MGRSPALQRLPQLTCDHFVCSTSQVTRGAFTNPCSKVVVRIKARVPPRSGAAPVFGAWAITASRESARRGNSESQNWPSPAARHHGARTGSAARRRDFEVRPGYQSAFSYSAPSTASTWPTRSPARASKKDSAILWAVGERCCTHALRVALIRLPHTSLITGDGIGSSPAVTNTSSLGK